MPPMRLRISQHQKVQVSAGQEERYCGDLILKKGARLHSQCENAYGYHVRCCMREKGNAPYPEVLPPKLQQSSCMAARCVAPPQQRYAAAKSTVPSRKSVTEAAIQLLLPVLGSDDVVAVAGLGLAVLATAVLVTVVVLVVVAAGFSEGFAVGPVVGSPAVGLALAEELSVPPPGTSRPSVSPAGGVAASGSITTCGATAPDASTTPLALKVPPAGVTNRADTSDPPMHATPLSAPVASSHEASTESRQPAAPLPRPASCRYTP